ncbi:hypothetical protein, partial [Paenibacillus endophyticus]|uniref:hypothetical protein n=1 Tax=Paenibacillus endophyticus TaxID=1294268 RepID=UPI0039F017CA
LMLGSPVNDGCVVTSILHESIHGLFFVHLAVALHITIRHLKKDCRRTHVRQQSSPISYLHG